jgi:hypothetical protein
VDIDDGFRAQLDDTNRLVDAEVDMIKARVGNSRQAAVQTVMRASNQPE